MNSGFWKTAFVWLLTVAVSGSGGIALFRFASPWLGERGEVILRIERLEIAVDKLSNKVDNIDTKVEVLVDRSKRSNPPG